MLKYLLVLLLLAGLATAHSGPAVIHMTEKGFSPERLEITEGQTVEFENVGSEPHWPASNIHPTHEIYSEFDPKAAVPPGETWKFTFNKPGLWRCHDHLNPDFTCTIRVKEATGFIASMKRFFNGIITGMFGAELDQHKYNESIAKDDERIFSDDDQLYSYIKKFGVKPTILHLNSLDSKLGDCHQTAHHAGRLAFELLGNDVFKDCSIECHSGCYHGAIESFFKEHGTTDIPSTLNVICGENLNEFAGHQCFHGIGHGLTAFFDYEIYNALELCDQLNRGQRSCYSGVFMENIVGSLAEGHKTKYLNDDPQYPCSAVDDKYKTDCYFFQTARMKELLKGNYTLISQACGEAPAEYQLFCFESMGRDISGDNNENPEKSIALCQTAPPGGNRISCLKGAVQDTLWDPSGQDNAMHFCHLLTDPDEKTMCYETIFYRATMIFTQESLKTFCLKAEEAYQRDCLTMQSSVS